MTKSSCLVGLSSSTAANEDFNTRCPHKSHGTPRNTSQGGGDLNVLHRTLEMERPFEEAGGDDFWANLDEREEIICSTCGSASFCYPIVSEINSRGLTKRT